MPVTPTTSNYRVLATEVPGISYTFEEKKVTVTHSYTWEDEASNN
jgi:hypothetical protein